MAVAPTTPSRLYLLAERFKEQKSVLLSISNDTEQEFVVFGREAGALSLEAKEMLEQVNGVIEASTGEGAREAVDLFDELVAAAGRLIAGDEIEIQSLMGEVSAVRMELERMMEHRLIMEGAVRMPLFLLKVGFRIEGAHSSERLSKTFEGVAMDIASLREKLILTVNEQFAGLAVAVRSMENLIATLSRMSEEARRQHGEAGARIEELERHAGQLREARQSQGMVAQRVSESSQSLHQQFNRVVMALQYHDITRQQLEHIGQAFDTMGEWLPAAKPEEVSQTGPEVALLQEASKLQAQQTRSALESLRTAGREFLEGLESISRGANNLAADVSAFSDLCRNEPVFRALNGLATLQTFIAARSEIKREVGEAACAIYGKVTDCTRPLQELTFDLRLLAINAQVQAANAGQRFVVEALAENICKVSESISEATQTLALEMEAIMKHLSELGSRAWALGTRHTAESRAMAAGIPRCVVLLREFQANVGAGLETISRRQVEFHERIERLLPTVNFPALASQRLESVLSFFEEIQRETIPFAGGSNASHEALAGFKSAYTMASEREVHESVQSDLAPDAAAAATELLHAPGISNAVEARGQELGENIELF